MSNETQIVRTIINNIESALVGAQCPQIMMANILDKAQTLINEDGYRYDVALTIACKMYPRTQHSARYLYEKA